MIFRFKVNFRFKWSQNQAKFIVEIFLKMNDEIGLTKFKVNGGSQAQIFSQSEVFVDAALIRGLKLFSC